MNFIFMEIFFTILEIIGIGLLFKKRSPSYMILCSIFICVGLIGNVELFRLPTSYVDEIKEVEDIAEYEDIPSGVNNYILIENVSGNINFIYKDHYETQIKIPSNDFILTTTQGDHAYLLIVDIVKYKGTIRVGKVKTEYRFFVPEQNYNRFLYIQDTPVN